MVFEVVGLLVGLEGELDLVVELGDLGGVALDFAGGSGERGLLGGGLTFDALQLGVELVEGVGELGGDRYDADLGGFGGGGVGELPQAPQKAESWEASPEEEGSLKAPWACWSSSAWAPAAPRAVFWVR